MMRHKFFNSDMYDKTDKNLKTKQQETGQIKT